MTLKEFMMEDSADCIFDAVCFFDGNHNSLGCYCGVHAEGLVLHSTTDVMRVEFFSDGSKKDSGFILEWAFVDLPTCMYNFKSNYYFLMAILCPG